MIDFNHTKQYTLSIRLSADGFCFAVHNPRNDSEYLFRPYPIDTTKPITANLKNAIEELELLNQSYQHTYLQIADGRYAITPKEFYSEQSARGLFAPNFTHIADRELILHNEVGDDNPAIILFGIGFTTLLLKRNIIKKIIGFAKKGDPMIYNNELMKVAMAVSQGSMCKKYDLNFGPDWTVVFTK